MSVGGLINLLRGVDRLLNLETKHGRAIERLELEIDALKTRVARLEAREEIVISEARAAASHAATQVAIASVSDISRRFGILEERTDRARLKPPT